MFPLTLIILGILNFAALGYAEIPRNTDNTYGYGFSSSYSGSSPPQNIQFENFFNEYLNSVRKYNEHFLSMLYQQIGNIGKQTSEYALNIPQFSQGASSVASIGPQGTYQKAAIFPENPNSPNIFSRFAAQPSGVNSDGGNYGVFTSSLSSSSNVDGKTNNFHRATTTINDNGKISTYTVKSP